ncbi:hypothetical protein O0L34_g13381 [Tuta absoluta]|nr:hypothetical protein O0L34_g13381 [Tuta absoluta]
MCKSLVVVLALVSCAYSASTPKKSDVVHPCETNGHTIDLKCVRENLEANSKCTRKGLKAIRPSYQLGKFKFETPYFNATYIDNDLVIQNHHKCFVSEFFYNLKTDVAVLSVDCPGLIFTSNRTLIQHTSKQEDKVYSMSSTWQYPLIRLTSNIQHANAMDICNSFVFTDVVQMPKFVVSPNDKPTKGFLSRDLSYLNIYERETFFYRGFQLFRHYISSAVCNFGCHA